MTQALPADLARAVALGDEMGRDFGAFDWDSHPLGHPSGWSGPVRGAVATALSSRFPIVLWLSNELYVVYNDAYIQVLSEKHPGALGRAGREVWGDIWETIGPMLGGVLRTGIATWSEDQMLLLVNVGEEQERYFTFTYSPLIETDGAISGIFCAVTETTARVLGERRLEALNALGAALLDVTSIDVVVRATIEVSAAHSADMPFVAAYLREAATDVTPAPLRAATPAVAQLFASVAPTMPMPDGSNARVLDLHSCGFPTLTTMLGQNAPQRALLLDIGDITRSALTGSLVVGLNPRLRLDDQYIGFCRRFADQVSGALGNAHAYEHERRRAEALAQLDQAKTTFLSNVSHEFRTPLTLMLGPLEDAITESDDPAATHRLEMVQRNGQRLQRMVNSLLDFSRLEAGEAKPQFVLSDVGARTAEIASAFAELCTSAGIDLICNCAPAFARLDPEMWETIVLNLVSNAFKFTLSGSITVEVTPDGSDEVHVSVADTGTGIAPEELGRLFERFYRPAGTRGRTAEGSRIGLALVRSMVEAHSGTVQVDSELGVGTTVTVRLPGASADSPGPGDGDHGAPPAPLRAASAYVTEASQWLDPATDQLASGPATGTRPRILVADDNRDMRHRLERILSARYDVLLVNDGDAALESIRRDRPDLVVTDVMMPTLDGFGLVSAIRADPSLQTLPVVMLSARAGLEASGEGFRAGADDYIVKPFRSADLLDRVAARLEAAARTRADQQALHPERITKLRELANALTSATSVTDAVDAVLELGPPMAAIGLIDRRAGLLRLTYAGAVDPLVADRYHTVALDAPIRLAETARSGRTVTTEDRVPLDPRNDRTPEGARVPRAGVSMPLRTADGAIFGVLGVFWPEPRKFEDHDLAFFEEVAETVSVTVDRVRTNEFEHHIATQLQDRLLRLDLRPTEVAVAALYQPANDEIRVGGDWYTALPVDDGPCVGVSVGDVVGHGVDAVVTMSQLRSALRATALTSDDPAAVVEVIDRYARHVPGAACATLAYLIVDPRLGTVRYCCAGHPYPMLVLPDGSVHYLEEGRRPPVGSSVPHAGAPSGQAAAPAGSLLVVYTDGLVERRGEDLNIGFDRLARVAATLVNEPVGEVCARLLVKLEPSGGFADDVALVALRPCGTTPTSFVDVVPASFIELPAARHRLQSWLADLPLDEARAYHVQVAVGEALTNAIEHGCGTDSAQQVGIEVFVVDGTLSATVSDGGRWLRDSASSARHSERGRGLTLIHGLSDGVSTVRTALGTRVTMTFGSPALAAAR